MEELCGTEVLKLAQKLWHIKRCTPKPKLPPRPVGRPRTPEEQKRGQEAWETLDGIFSKLLKIKGEEAFMRLYGAHKLHVVGMMRNGDWQGLERFLAERGWEK